MCCCRLLKAVVRLWKFNLPEEEQSLSWLNQQQKKDHWPALLKVAGNRPLAGTRVRCFRIRRAQGGILQGIRVFSMQVRANVTKISVKHQDEQLERLVSWQQAWCADLIRCHYDKEPVTLENPDIRRSLHSLVGRVDLHSLFRFMDKLIELRRFSSAPLNKRLFIEDMLIRCQEVLEQPV